VAREVVFAPEARDDLIQLYDHIAADAGTARAHAYTQRIVDYCESFVVFPERGTRRDGLRPGLRTIGFGRRLTIVFHVGDVQIVIDRVLYGGRNLPTAIDHTPR